MAVGKKKREQQRGKCVRRRLVGVRFAGWFVAEAAARKLLALQQTSAGVPKYRREKAVTVLGRSCAASGVRGDLQITAGAFNPQLARRRRRRRVTRLAS